MIYGNKEPEKIKQLIRDMFNMKSSVFNSDFYTYIKILHQYIESSSSIKKDSDQISLLESLTKKIDPKLNRPSNTKSNFKNF